MFRQPPISNGGQDGQGGESEVPNNLAAIQGLHYNLLQSHRVALLVREANLGDVARRVLKRSTRIRNNFPKSFQR
jgi:hypothetical protein